MKKFFITGGGTGGHIYPAIAVADALNDSEIFYVGNPDNMEYGIVKSKGYKFLPVNVHGMPRKISVFLLIWCVQLFSAILKSCFYILKYKPNAVFGTGGYVSAPALIAAKILRIPYMMHDCDAQPGLVTRKLASGAGCVSVAFEKAREFINNSDCVVNGNPIRKEFSILTKEYARESLNLQNKLTICFMGGSQGARSINDVAVNIIKILSKEYDVQVIFQTGKKNFDHVIQQLIKIYPEYQVDANLIIKPYFEDMVKVLKSADISVCRAGSLSISEICASAVAPVFVPLPHAASDHQRKNARFVVENGAGFYIEDTELNLDSLKKILISLISDNEKLKKVQEKSLALAKFDSVDKIAEQLYSICK